MHKDKVKTSYSWCLTSALVRWTEMRSLANWLKLLSLKPSSHSRCSSALSSSLFHGAATPPSPATPTPASLQVTSIPPSLQHSHQHPYRSPLYTPPHDIFDAHFTYGGLVYDVIDTDCWAQNGSFHGRVFSTFFRTSIFN